MENIVVYINIGEDCNPAYIKVEVVLCLGACLYMLDLTADLLSVPFLTPDMGDGVTVAEGS